MSLWDGIMCLRPAQQNKGVMLWSLQMANSMKKKEKIHYGQPTTVSYKAGGWQSLMHKRYRPRSYSSEH